MRTCSGAAASGASIVSPTAVNRSFRTSALRSILEREGTVGKAAPDRREAAGRGVKQQQCGSRHTLLPTCADAGRTDHPFIVTVGGRSRDKEAG